MPADLKRRALLAPDKFRSTATAAQLRAALERAAEAVGFEPIPCPIADGGEGLLEAFGGVARLASVHGPLGDPVLAEWRLLESTRWGRTAVIEMARASGLALVGDASKNDPVAASTFGTGELVRAAIEAGAQTVIVGCGGSATTDGGEGALSAIRDAVATSGVRLLVAYDVRTRFLDAATVFAPQKGASPPQVELLSDRLSEIAGQYRRHYGRDVTALEGSGAAGGLGGGLAALGGELVPGVALVAEHVGLDALVERSDAVITGEGRLDETSLAGKVVGELVTRCRGRRPLLVICGRRAVDLAETDGLVVVSLVDRFGEQDALERTLACVEEVARDFLGDRRRFPPEPAQRSGAT